MLSAWLNKTFLSVLIHMYKGRKEGNVLFNDALNTFYLRLYGVGHMVKDHSDSERGNPLPPHGLLFLIGSKGSFICIIPQPLYPSWRALVGTRNSSMGSTMKDRSDNPSHHERTLLSRTYILLPHMYKSLGLTQESRQAICVSVLSPDVL